MSEAKTHTIFWRKKPLVERHLGDYAIIEYRMYKAINKNTLRRLKGQGWQFEAGKHGEELLRTEKECKKEIERLNARQAAEIDEGASILKKSRDKLTAPADDKPTTRSLLLKPLGRGN